MGIFECCTEMPKVMFEIESPFIFTGSKVQSQKEIEYSATDKI